jgi:hypothetical protein
MKTGKDLSDSLNKKNNPDINRTPRQTDCYCYQNVEGAEFNVRVNNILHVIADTVYNI